ARELRQGITERNIVAVALAAEVAADVAGMNDQTGRRDLERVRHRVAHAERTLVRRPNVRGAVHIDPDQRSMRLDIGLMNRRHPLHILYNYITLPHTHANTALLS